MVDKTQADSPLETWADPVVVEAGKVASLLPREISSIPILIERYRILERIGAGGMGTVYRAHDPQLDRNVALKLVRREHARSPKARERLLREARALAKISHPNVISIFDGGIFGEEVYIVMELMTGKTLRDWLREGPHSIHEIISVFTSAGRGLAAAHLLGLVHRDFKPTNVLMGQSGEAVVVDFGLARGVEAGWGLVCASGETFGAGIELNDGGVTCLGAVPGTPRYMAPEQARGGRVDARTDQYSFCVVLQEGLAQAAASCHGRKLAGIHRVLRKGRSEDPSDRFASMEELLNELSQTGARPARRSAWAQNTQNFQRRTRHDLFVGRRPQLHTFGALLRKAPTGAQVLFVHGPGGCGKTSLLLEFAFASEAAGIPYVQLDMRSISPSLSGFCDALGWPASPMRWPKRKQVLLVDSFEAAGALGAELQSSFLPRVSPQLLVVVAARSLPSLGWKGVIFEAMRLADLSASESEEYLRRRGIPAERHPEILAFARGHPLALSLVAESVAQEPRQCFRPEHSPELVQALIRCFMDGVPLPEHQAALEACAVLGIASDPQSRSWLQKLSFIETGPEGIALHPVARDVLVLELAFRDPDRLRELEAHAHGLCSKPRKYVSSSEGHVVVGDGQHHRRCGRILK